MNIVQLTSSTFFGGPERQMLGLAQSLAPLDRTLFLSFAEGGRCGEFLAEVQRRGWEGRALVHDTPWFFDAIGEIRRILREESADILCCHGYKANILGRLAARGEGLPVIAVSRGWTGESLKVRIYEALDRLTIAWMDRVVCVSEGQAVKVRRAGVPEQKITVIRNAIRGDRFDTPNQAYRKELEGLFPKPPRRIVGAAGRLSPDKGFKYLIEAARTIVDRDPSTGFVLFGGGWLRDSLVRNIAELGLTDHFVLGGFRRDLDRIIPWLDILVLPSFTEGLPNIVLESCAAGVPVVATAVGGTPEVIDDGKTGYLIPPGDAEVIANRIWTILNSEDGGQKLGQGARQKVLAQFTFEAQAQEYRRLFGKIKNQLPRGDVSAHPEQSLAPEQEGGRQW